MTQTTDTDGTSQLARTVRALELLGQSHTAYARGDHDACDALVRQARTEAGPDTVEGIRGGMLIGEIPKPYDEGWNEYLDHQRDRLAEEQQSEAAEYADDEDEPLTLRDVDPGYVAEYERSEYYDAIAYEDPDR